MNITNIYCLFTPYGYKFESVRGPGWNEGSIGENYKSTAVADSRKNTFRFTIGGVIDIVTGVGGMRGFGGEYWSATPNLSASLTHDFNIGSDFVYPAHYDLRNRYGYSVGWNMFCDLVKEDFVGLLLNFYTLWV